MKSNSSALKRIAVFLMAAACLLTFGSRAHAQLTVTFADGAPATLLPNQAGQVVDLLVENTGGLDYSVIGITLEVQIGDGGETTAPKITAVDVVVPGETSPSTLFESNHGVQGGGGKISNQMWERGVLTGSGSEPFNDGDQKLLARVTFDTTGFSAAQDWVLKLNNTLNGNSHYILDNAPDLPVNFSGTISVVPEVNGSFAVALALGTFAALWRYLRAQGGMRTSCKPGRGA